MEMVTQNLFSLAVGGVFRSLLLLATAAQTATKTSETSQRPSRPAVALKNGSESPPMYIFSLQEPLWSPEYDILAVSGFSKCRLSSQPEQEKWESSCNVQAEEAAETKVEKCKI